MKLYMKCNVIDILWKGSGPMSRKVYSILPLVVLFWEESIVHFLSVLVSIWKGLLTGTLPVNNSLLTGTLP